VLAVSVLARQALGERQGNFAVVLFCLFPGAYIFSQVYTEALFVLVAAICLYALHRRLWWVAGLAATLSGTIRSTGIILMVCCLWVALREIWLRRDWSSLVAPALSPIGLAAFFLFLKARTGTARAYLLTQQHAWGQTFTLHALPVELQFFFAAHKPHSKFLSASYAWVVLVFLLWAVVGLVLLGVFVYRRRMPSEWFVFSLGVIAATLVTNTVGVRPRMALAAFPLFFAYAGVLKRWWTMIPAVALSIAGLAFLAQGVPGYIP
jgi:hypothetical protein